MPSITIASAYGSSASSVTFQAETSRAESKAVNEASSADSFSISEKARLAFSTSANNSVLTLLQSAGRQPFTATTMKDLSPPAADDNGRASYKGTSSLLDSRAAKSLREVNLDVTIGGPDGLASFKENSPFGSGSSMLKTLGKVPSSLDNNYGRSTGFGLGQSSSVSSGFKPPPVDLLSPGNLKASESLASENESSTSRMEKEKKAGESEEKGSGSIGPSYGATGAATGAAASALPVGGALNLLA